MQIVCSHFNRLALRLLLKPEKFEIPFPIRARPPPKRCRTNTERRAPRLPVAFVLDALQGVCGRHAQERRSCVSERRGETGVICFSGLFVEQREEFRILVTFPIAIVFPSSRSEKRPSCCMVSKVSMHTGRERVKRAITMLLLFTKRGCFFWLAGLAILLGDEVGDDHLLDRPCGYASPRCSRQSGCGGSPAAPAAPAGPQTRARRARGGPRGR